MSDQLLMDNYLLVLKSTMEVYVHGTLESSNEDIRQLLKDGLNNTQTNQANTYDEMTKYGWYNVKDVEQTSIKETLNKVSNN